LQKKLTSCFLPITLFIMSILTKGSVEKRYSYWGKRGVGYIGKLKWTSRLKKGLKKMIHRGSAMLMTD